MAVTSAQHVSQSQSLLSLVLDSVMLLLVFIIALSLGSISQGHPKTIGPDMNGKLGIKDSKKVHTITIDLSSC